MTVDAPTRTERAWVLIAAVLCIAGIVSAWFGANAVAGTAADRSLHQFDSTGRQIAARMQLALEHEADLVATAKAYVTRNPNVATTEFVNWATDEQALARYPELTALGLVRFVPASDLDAFAAAVRADSYNALPPGPFAPSPAGERPFYCLVAAGAAERTVIPNNYDFCARGGGSGILHARDTGRGSYEPVTIAGETYLGFEEPVYAGGGVPPTLDARRQQLVGWVGMVIKPSQLLRASSSGFAVRMQYSQFNSDVAFSRGRPPSHAETLRLDLGNGWTIAVFGKAISSSVLHDGSALALLIAGIIVSLLVGALVVVLATGQSRAQRLVYERTNALRHLALHDSLTGLANRTLLRDRCEQLVARSSRVGSIPAALFIDLDHFKRVNDTFGHEAGDELLVAVAERLSGVVREADTIARLGGDEFVILFDAVTLTTAPAVVAERLREIVGRPYDLADGVTTLSVTASIGVSTGPVESPDVLLRRADAALYRAKASGRDAVAVFDAAMEPRESNLLAR